MKQFITYVVIFLIATLLPLLICELSHDELVAEVITFDDITQIDNVSEE